jgi:hypothetical protein
MACAVWMKTDSLRPHIRADQSLKPGDFMLDGRKRCKGGVLAHWGSGLKNC